jgi:hypothetical protein
MEFRFEGAVCHSLLVRRMTDIDKGTQGKKSDSDEWIRIDKD